MTDLGLLIPQVRVVERHERALVDGTIALNLCIQSLRVQDETFIISLQTSFRS